MTIKSIAAGYIAEGIAHALPDSDRIMIINKMVRKRLFHPVETSDSFKNPSKHERAERRKLKLKYAEDMRVKADTGDDTEHIIAASQLELE